MLIRDIARCKIVLVGEHRTDGKPRKHVRTSESVKVWTVCLQECLPDVMQLEVAALIWTGYNTLGGWLVMLVLFMDREFAKYGI